MSDYTPEDIVRYSSSEDGARAQEAIQGVLADKVMKALESKKAEVAQAMFNSALGTTKQAVADPSPRTEPSVETPKENAVEA
jgi:hypothetical protein